MLRTGKVFPGVRSSEPYLALRVYPVCACKVMSETIKQMIVWNRQGLARIWRPVLRISMFIKRNKTEQTKIVKDQCIVHIYTHSSKYV